MTRPAWYRLSPEQKSVASELLRIDPDDLSDDEWDRVMALGAAMRAPPPAPGRHVADYLDGIWRVIDTRATLNGFDIHLGRPEPASGPRGAAVILTGDLVDYLNKFRRAPDLIDLPLSRTTLKRLRRVLGHNWYEDGERWWLARLNDLETLTAADFAVRHGVKPSAAVYARAEFVGPVQRRAGWWRDAQAADLILSPQPRLYIAQMLGICASSVGRLRTELRRERGEPMDAAAAAERIRANKTGRPAHENTRAALREAATRPKSAEWRAGLSERNRARPRPASWVEREWSAEEDACLGRAPDRQVSERLGRTIAAVRSRRASLGIAAHSRP